MHRVITPNQNEGEIPKRRQSIAYFQNPNFDAEISCLPTCLSDGLSPKYQSIKAGNYLMSRFHSAIE
jgi:isopenicillin N synthase-like dioxygenase